MKSLHYLMAALLGTVISASATTVEHRQDAHDLDTYTVNITIALDDKDQMYQETLDLSLNSPNATISSWNATTGYQQQYVESLKATKSVYTGSIPVVVEIKRTEPIDIEDANIHIRFVTSMHGPEEHVVPVTFTTVQKTTPTSCPPVVREQHVPKESGFQIKTPLSLFGNISLSDYVSDLTQKTQSLWIRLLLVFILGMLLSLTPCIYPMIPITIGVLQSQGSTSFGRNVAVALSYTLGIATTFALFGLIASFTGPIYGYLLGNPFFVLFLVAILGYLGFSMLGLYDMHIPSFLQSSSSQSNNSGSLVSAFLFGAASGTIASPCVSPGLVLLLSIVATMANPFLGFLLLFVFGFGLSTPLLIIGTFSSSLSMLPRAGMWMVEIKRFFGFLLLGMCVYYLNNILPWHYILWISGSGTVLAGLHYLWIAQFTRSSFWKKLQALAGMALIMTSVIICSSAYKETIFSQDAQESSIWLSDYEAARAQAQTENKPLLLDFWATYCSLCKEIDKNLFKDASVQDAVKELTVPVKINGTQPSQEPYATLRKQYKVTGLPLYILINPHDGSVIRTWNSQLYCATPESFIKELTDAVASFKKPAAS